MKKFLILLSRELNINIKNFSVLITNLIFFSMSIFIFVMSFSNDLDSVKSYVHCVIWVVLLFNIIFSTEQFFESDFSDGSIKELLTTGYNFFEIILSKFLSILIVILLPIILILPFFAYTIDNNYLFYDSLIKSVIFGGPSIILITLIGQILLSSLRKNKVLLFILLVPFYIPTFIFAIGAVELEMIQQSPDKNFYILIGIFMITFSISLITGKLAMEELNN